VGVTEKNDKGTVMFSGMLMLGALCGFIVGTLIPRKPTVMIQTVPAVCSSTVNVHVPPSPESCELVRDMTGGHKAPVVEHDPESLIPAIAGTWRALDGSVTVVVDPPRSPAKLRAWTGKKPPYHLTLTLPKEPLDWRWFGCDFLIEGTVHESHGPLANKIQYRAWCRDHKAARVAFKLDEDELTLALQVEGEMKVTSTKLVRTP
jgi:hypothetical protein